MDSNSAPFGRVERIDLTSQDRPPYSGQPQDRAPNVPKSLVWIEYAYLLRFPIFSALLLAVLLPVLFFAVPSIFVGLFDARGKWSLAFIVWIALDLAWSIMVTSRLVLVYAPDRFLELAPVSVRRSSFRVVLLFALLCVPCLTLVWHGSQDISLGGKLTAIALGVVASIAMLFVAAVIHFALEPQGRGTAARVVPSFGFLQSTGRLPALHFRGTQKLEVLPSEMFRGLMDGKRLRSGHEFAAIQLGLLVIAYVIIGICFFPERVAPDNQPATMFYALFLVTLLTWFFSGVAFVCDRFRIPALAIVLCFSFLTGAVHTDHKFEISHNALKHPIGQLGPADVIKNWAGKRGAAGKPVIVVATAGGGIQASAWTARVLTGLQGDCGEKFSSSLLLVSSVSGGSAGTMYFLAAYNGGDGHFSDDQKTLADIWDNASRSSLSAVGWGLLYPDLLRTVPGIGSIVPETFDRGRALENAWITGWKEPPNISDWRADVAQGTRPAVIFNATAAESGQRFVIASTDTDQNPGVIQFANTYSGWDIPVATSARLSANFPFVSPISRSSKASGVATSLHVADGGYYDNSGVLSAVDWLEQATDSLRGHEVVLITIDGSNPDPAKGQSWSWQRQLIAPLETVIHVRTSSQRYRDGLEDRLAREALQGKGVIVRPISFDFPAQLKTPLSWHLTSSQRAQIISSWKDSSLAHSKGDLGKVLGCTIQ
jgi:hypothetical protein